MSIWRREEKVDSNLFFTGQRERYRYFIELLTLGMGGWIWAFARKVLLRGVRPECEIIGQRSRGISGSICAVMIELWKQFVWQNFCECSRVSPWSVGWSFCGLLMCGLCGLYLGRPFCVDIFADGKCSEIWRHQIGFIRGHLNLNGVSSPRIPRVSFWEIEGIIGVVKEWVEATFARHKRLPIS